MEKKPHLVNRKMMCLDRRSGGLGVKNLDNKGLLSKWCWQFAMERGALRSEMIRGKYGET